MILEAAKGMNQMVKPATKSDAIADFHQLLKTRHQTPHEQVDVLSGKDQVEDSYRERRKINMIGL